MTATTRGADLPPGDPDSEPVRWEVTWRQLALILVALVLVGLGIFAFVRLTT